MKAQKKEDFSSQSDAMGVIDFGERKEGRAKPVARRSRLSRPADKRFLNVPLSNVQTRPDGQVRTTPPESTEGFESLVDSIRQRGVITPIQVTQDTEDDIFWIDAGHRRVAAARVAGAEAITAVVVQGSENAKEGSKELSILQITENLHRQDLSPLETGQALSGLIELGPSATQLAEALGKSKSWVSRHLQLLALEPKAAVRASELGLPLYKQHAIASANLPDNRQMEAVESASIMNEAQLRKQIDVIRASDASAAPAARLGRPNTKPEKVFFREFARLQKSVEQCQDLAEALSESQDKFGSASETLREVSRKLAEVLKVTAL